MTTGHRRALRAHPPAAQGNSSTLEDKHCRDRSRPLGRRVARRARKDLDKVQDRRAEVVQLRAQGWTWDRIASHTGYSNGSAASKAWRAAIKQRPDLAVTEIRAQERERLEEMDAKLAEIIASPPAQHSAIGKIVVDDEGNVVRNMSIVVQALKERRMVGESYRRLCGADAAPAALVLSEQLVTQYARARAVQDQMDHQAPVPLAALPDDYSAMSAEQQAQVQLERHRARVTAQRTVIRGELAE